MDTLLGRLFVRSLFFYYLCIQMKELQFSIVVLMVLMCSALILLMPGR